jgi:P27 family predicted phage terminase small subunit
VECPPGLSAAARKEWDRVAPELAALGRLTPLDRGPLAVYCNAYASWEAAEEMIQSFGAVMKSPSGYPVQSAYVSIAFKHAEIVMRLAAEFGFAPASRERLRTPSNSSTWDDIPTLDPSDFKPLELE